MNDKLLRAFIEASGFDVEEVSKTYEPESHSMGTYFRSPTNDYKVTKKPLPEQMDSVEIMTKMFVYDDAWGCIVKFTLSHADDIENDINDFGSLKPLVKFINRNC